MSSTAHHSVAIVGGSQAGLSLSHYLIKRSIDHVVFEKHRAMMATRGPQYATIHTA